MILQFAFVICATFLFVASTLAGKRCLSFTLTSLTIMAVGFIYLCLKTLQVELIPEYRGIILYSWYVIVITTSFLTIWGTNQLHASFGIELSWLANTSNVYHFVGCCVEFSRFMDRIVLETDVLGTFYRYWGKISLSAISVLILTQAIVVLWKYRRNPFVMPES